MRGNTFFRIALTASLAFCLAGQAFAGGGGEKKGDGELPVLRVATIPWLLSVPAIFVEAQGWDVENGFKVELSSYPMGAPMFEAMGSNLWDIGAVGPAAIFAMANTGLKLIAEISSASGGTGAFIRPDHPAAKIKGQVPGYPNVYGNAATLRGSKVLVPVGSLNHFNVQKWFDIFGLTGDDLQVVHMDNAPSFQAFKIGEGDITAFSPPLSYRARDEEGWINAGGCPELNIDVWDNLYANPRMYNQKKDLIVAFVKQMYRATDYLAANQDRAAQVLYDWQVKNGINSNLDLAKAEVRARTFKTSDAMKNNKGALGNSMRLMAEFYVSIGTLEKEKLASFNAGITSEILDLALR